MPKDDGRQSSRYGCVQYVGAAFRRPVRQFALPGTFLDTIDR